MSLTTGAAPFGRHPAGRFEPPVPADAVYVEPLLRRVRAKLGDRAVIDSERVVLVHRAGIPPTYAFPAEDVRDLPTSPDPAARGYVRVPWDAASAWYEEEEHQVDGTLVRDVAWSYEDPLPESTPIACMLGFYADRTKMIQAVPAWFTVPPPANPRVLEQDHTHG